MTGLEFRSQLAKFKDERTALMKKEIELQAEMKLHGEKFGGFLRECGLPENFSLEEWGELAIRKANEQ